jgi:hypothetical protein
LGKVSFYRLTGKCIKSFYQSVKLHTSQSTDVGEPGAWQIRIQTLNNTGMETFHMLTYGRNVVRNRRTSREFISSTELS